MAELKLSSEVPRPGYTLVDSYRVYEDLLRSVANTDRLSFDYETTAYECDNYLRITDDRKRPLDLIRSSITSASFRTRDEKCYYLSIDHQDSFNMPKESVIDVLKAKPKPAPICCHNTGFEWSISKLCLGINLEDFGPLEDTMLAAYVIDTNQAVGLKDLTRRYIGILQESYKSVTAGCKMNELTARQVLHYGCDDSEYQWALGEKFNAHLRELNLWDYYVTLELPLIPIIAQASIDGAYVDPILLEEKTKIHLKHMARIANMIYDMLGHEVTLSSPVQMSKVLYGELGLRMPPYAESATATDKESLYWLINAHPVIPLFLEWKKYATRYKLYDKPYANLIHNDTGMVHSQLRQAVTDTSRFSSSGPNLQQLAKRGDGVEVRELFSAPEHLGYKYIMACDMSQVELVLAAHRSRDANMLAEYGPKRGDVHTKTTCGVFSITPEQAKSNKVYRQAGKTANFSLLYGGQAKRIYRLIRLELAKLGLPCPFTLRDAEHIVMKWFQLYPGIKEMQKNDVKYAREHGYVKSLFGRRFYLPDIVECNSYIRSKAERKATNSPIQGTCAELIKRAIIRIHKEGVPREDMRMVTSIHDENVFYVSEKAARDVVQMVHRHMSDTPQGFRAYMESEPTLGYNFGEMKSVEVYLP